MLLADYVRRLDAHDWYYTFSDDPRWYRAGERERNELIRLSKISPEHREFYENRKAHWSGQDIPLKELPK